MPESSQLANDLVSDATVTAADERDSDVLFRTQIERYSARRTKPHAIIWVISQLFRTPVDAGSPL